MVIRLVKFLFSVWLVVGVVNVLQAEEWLEVPVGVVDLSSQTVLKDAVQYVKDKNLTGIILRIDSPGGSLEVMRSMIQIILDAPFPIISWIPKGGRAGSAASFIAISSYVLVMSLGTNIGASIPVTATGKDLDKDIKTKAQNDLMAFVDSICEMRSKNKEMIHSFIKLGTSITEKEALAHGVADLISSAHQDMFSKLFGRKIKIKDDLEFEFSDKNPKIEEYQKTILQKIMSVIASPNICYLLFIAGIIGLGVELTHPGVMFPGVFGALSLILSFIAMSVLPINYGGLLLIVLGLILLIAEAFIPSFGVVGFGGAISFVLGSFFLVDPSNEQGLRLAWSTIIPVSVCFIGVCLFIGYVVVSTLRRKKPQIADVLLTQEARVVRVDDTALQVSINGEIWNAKAVDPQTKFEVGQIVKVSEVKGLEVFIEEKK